MNEQVLVNEWTAVSTPTYATQRLISVSQPAPNIDPQTFLAQAQGKPRFFWRDASIEQNHTPLTYSAYGIAANLTAWGKNRFQNIHQQAKSLFEGAHLTNTDHPPAAPRLFGGFSFRDDFAPDNTWSIYHPAQFILPHFQLVHSETECWLTVNALVHADEPIEETVTALTVALSEQAALLQESTAVSQNRAVSPPQINYPMPFDTWANIINDAVAQMNSTDLKKVVLARICELKFKQAINIDHALDYLLNTYPDCYTFLFEPRAGHGFIGATPELLARVNGRNLTTMGLAGSIARGKTEAEAVEYGRQLLNSQKDQHEHALVVQALRERLAPLTESLTISDAPRVLRFSNIQHLYTPVHATLKNNSGILPLVSQLHPTPALGGAPRDKAMEFIRHAEPVPRGWYAGPIGMLDFNLDGAFGVAIRSAAIQDRRAWLYAGAGMVADSKPDLEWAETELKFRPMRNALGVE